MGAIINQLFYWKRNKIQSIGKRLDLLPFFIPNNNSNSFKTKISISDAANNKYEFDNMWILTLLIINKGNSDFNEFIFGIDFPENVKVINSVLKDANRFHKVDLNENPQPNNNLNKIDIKFAPFNRYQKYEIDFYLTSVNDIIETKDIKLITSHPVNFIEIKNSSELLDEIARSLVLSIGPIKLTIPK